MQRPNVDIVIYHPVIGDALTGNIVTAERWKDILERLGHSVECRSSYEGEQVDVAICLHAYKIQPIIEAMRREDCGTYIVLALTGTDIYGPLRNDPRTEYSIVESRSHRSDSTANAGRVSS